MLYLMLMAILLLEIIHDAYLEKICECHGFYAIRHAKIIKGLGILFALSIVWFEVGKEPALFYLILRIIMFDPLLYIIAGRNMPYTISGKIMYIIKHSEIYYWLSIFFVVPFRCAFKELKGFRYVLAFIEYPFVAIVGIFSTLIATIVSIVEKIKERRSHA